MANVVELLNSHNLTKEAGMSNLIHKNEKGFVFPVGLMFLAIIALLGTMAVVVTTTDLKIGNNYKQSVQAFYAAEAGIEDGLNKMRQAFQSLTPDLNISTPTINGVTFDEFKLEAVGESSRINLTGNFAGLNAVVQNYKITSKARMNGTNACSELTLTVRDELIPIFQFGIFYEDDMEILPGPSMTFSGGRIHSNKDIYLNAGSGSKFSIDSNITSAGNIYHRRKDNGAISGEIEIKDKDGAYKAMDIDSNDANWATQSQETWGGTVKSTDHGIQELNVPTEAGTPRDLLGTGAGSLCSQSGLRIINGAAEDKDGNPVDLTDGGTVEDPISYPTFFDHREDTWITVTEVDMTKLQLSQNAMTALDNPPEEGGDQGILYVSSDDGTNKSVRLINGDTLPEGGLTVASNNPVYIQGDYNNATNSPAAVICDAITILSNDWDDANSEKPLGTHRIASDTTVNAAIMAGNKNTVGRQYSGGVENFPRFLETWSDKTFTYSGSLICLWESQQATGDWGYGSPVYTAPIRDWSYGIDASLPPGTPRVRNIARSGWHQAIE